MKPSTFQAIISGERRDWFASACRGLGNCTEPIVRWFTARRNAAYDRGLKQIHRVAAPVVSIGNLTVGGTGKTPLTAWLVARLAERERKAVIVSRGYGARGGAPNDEALELAAVCPGTPHRQNRDRVLAAAEALRAEPDAVIVLDDGFQHRRLHRDLDLVALDATSPFGYERLLPRGLLREPVENVRRAHAVILTRADLVSSPERTAIRERILAAAPHIAWSETAQVPLELIDFVGAKTSLEALRSARFAAFCGIGNPLGFRNMLAQWNGGPLDFTEFPDHHRYASSDLGRLEDSLRKLGKLDFVLCTHKDLVKIPRDSLGGVPLRAVRIGVSFLAGERELLDLTETMLERYYADSSLDRTRASRS